MAEGESCVGGRGTLGEAAGKGDLSDTGLPKCSGKKGVVVRNSVGALEPTAYNPLLVCRSPLPFKSVTSHISITNEFISPAIWAAYTTDFNEVS